MPRRFLTILALAVTCAPTLAQGEPNPASSTAPSQSVGFGSSGTHLFQLPAWLQERLGITPEQKKKLADIDARVRFESPVQAGTMLTKEQRRAAYQKLLVIERKAEAEAEAVLTPEQKKQWEVLRTDAEQFVGLGRYAKSLLTLPDLTDPQRVKLRQLITQVREQRVKAFQAAQAAGPQARQQFAAGQRVLDEEILKALRGILTPTQFQQVDPASRPAPRRRRAAAP